MFIVTEYAALRGWEYFYDQIFSTEIQSFALYSPKHMEI